MKSKSPILYTLPLVKLSDNNLPEAGGSGCFIEVLDKQILMGVRHVTIKGRRWAIHLWAEPGPRACHYIFPSPTYFKIINSTNFCEDCDFFCVAMPSRQIARHQVFENLNFLKEEHLRQSFSFSDIEEPNYSDSYSFCGWTRHELIGTGLEIQLKEQDGLKYLRSEDPILFFKLPHLHPGHENYAGCSGAPVISESGRLVGLVMGGIDATNEIVVFSLSGMRGCLEAEAQGIFDSKDNSL